MSFEDQLRKQMPGAEYTNRDEMLRQWASECVSDFKQRCLAAASFDGKTTFTNVAINNHSVVRAYDDAEYRKPETDKRSAILLSEAEAFQSYLMDEFIRNDMSYSMIKMVQTSITLQVKDFYVGQKQVTHTYPSYEFLISLSWE